MQSCLPTNYADLNWCDKLDLFDPADLSIWQMHNMPRLVPGIEQAKTIKLKGSSMKSRPPLDMNELKREAIRDEAVSDFVALANRTITSEPLRALLGDAWMQWMKQEQGISRQNQAASLSMLTIEDVCRAELHRTVAVLEGAAS